MFNNGSFWLSENKEILNPYFGNKMLKCGETKETIDLNFKNPHVNNKAHSGGDFSITFGCKFSSIRQCHLKEKRPLDSGARF